MEKKLGEKLTELRVRYGLSQHDIAEKLNHKGFSVTNQAVSKWEKNYTIPNAYQFLALCDILKVNDVLATLGDSSITAPLSMLNEEGKKKADEYITLLLASGLYKNIQDNVIPITRRLKLFDLPVSAGTGEFLDSDSYELIEVGQEVPVEADYGVRISGNSMEPQFINGQIVWIHKQDILNDSEIGIFGYENQAYCKKLSLTTAGAKLVSLNTDYKPIMVLKDSELYVFGKVVG